MMMNHFVPDLKSDYYDRHNLSVINQNYYFHACVQITHDSKFKNNSGLKQIYTLFIFFGKTLLNCGE